MTRTAVRRFILGLFMFVLTAAPLHLLNTDLVKTAYAYVSYGENHDWERILGRESDGDNILGQYNQILDKGNKRDNGDRDKSQGQGNDENNGISYTIFNKDNKGDSGDLHYILSSGNDQSHDGRYKIGVYNSEGDTDCRHKNGGYNIDWDYNRDKYYDHDDHCKKSVPEPGTLSLLGAGIAGIGVYSFIPRKSNK